MIVGLSWVGISSTASGSGDIGDEWARVMLDIVDIFILCLFTIYNFI